MRQREIPVPGAGLSTPGAIRVGILGASKSALSVWKPLHRAGLAIVAVGGCDLKDAESFIGALNGGADGKTDAHSSAEEGLQQKREPHEAKNVMEECKGPEVRACTFDKLVSSRDVDVVYMTVPVELRDHWVIKCIQQRKHVLLSPPAAPSVAVLQKWMGLATPSKLLLTDDAALMDSRRMERMWSMFRGAGEISLGALRDLRVCCSVGRSKNSLTFSSTCADESSHFGVLGDLGWLAVATVLHAMQNEMPTTVVGRALRSKGANTRSVTEFSGELIFSDAVPPVTTSIYVSRSPEAAAEQSLTAHGATGSVVLHDLIVPAPDADGNHIITVVSHEAVQNGNLYRNIRCEKEVQVSETVPWEVCPWQRLRDALTPNQMYRGEFSLVSRFFGNTEEGLTYMKRSWRIQAVVDALLDAARMSDEEEKKADERNMADLKHLHTAWDVDRHIVLEGEKLVLIRFSHYEAAPPQVEAGGGGHVGQMAHYVATQQMDEVLVALAPKVRKYCVVYAVSTTEVPEFNGMYELGHDREPFAVMFFFRNAHIRVDVGTGNNNKINFFMEAEELLPIIDTAYRAGRSGKTITSSEKKFTTAAVRR